MANGGKEDAVEMAKLVQVRRRLVEVRDAQGNQWRVSLPGMMAASMKLLGQRSAAAARGIGTTTIDGTFYSLWYDQSGSSIFFRAFDRGTRSMNALKKVYNQSFFNCVVAQHEIHQGLGDNNGV
jgi:hypothetical protein